MKITVKNLRCMYPKVFKAEDFQGNGVFKDSADLVVKKGSPQDKQIQEAIKKAATDAWGKDAEKVLNSIKGNPGKFCYRDCTTKDAEGYDDDCMFFKASQAKEKGKPLTLDADKTVLDEDTGRFYSGCYVNASVDFYTYDNSGKGITCGLRGIQFAKDGDRFSGGSPASLDDFEDLTDGADAEADAFL